MQGMQADPKKPLDGDRRIQGWQAGRCISHGSKNGATQERGVASGGLKSTLRPASFTCFPAGLRSLQIPRAVAPRAWTPFSAPFPLSSSSSLALFVASHIGNSASIHAPFDGGARARTDTDNKWDRCGHDNTDRPLRAARAPCRGDYRPTRRRRIARSVAASPMLSWFCARADGVSTQSRKCHEENRS